MGEVSEIAAVGGGIQAVSVRGIDGCLKILEAVLANGGDLATGIESVRQYRELVAAPLDPPTPPAADPTQADVGAGGER